MIAEGRRVGATVKEDLEWVRELLKQRSERELSKQALAAHVSALDARVRDELDWRARLRRDGLALCGHRDGDRGHRGFGGGAQVAPGRRKEKQPVSVTSLDDVAAQLEEIREELARRRKKSGPLWQKLAVRAATTAAAAGGAAVARRAMERMAGSDEPATGNDTAPGVRLEADAGS